MPIDDSGQYVHAGTGTSGLCHMQDYFVWPPGWKPTAVESVALDTSVTVAANDILYGIAKTAGLVYDKASTLSRSAVYAPSGLAASVIRIPKFIVNTPSSRGAVQSGGSVSLVSTYKNICISSISRSTGGGTATVNCIAEHGFVVGQRVWVSGMGGAGYNGSFTITAKGAGSISYVTGGIDESLTTDTGGYVKSNPFEFWRRIRQLKSLTGWCKVTGPAPAAGTPMTSSEDNPSGTTWARGGVLFQLVMRFGKPWPFFADAGVPEQAYSVWAPIAAESTPDFCVDADIPSFQTIRIVWVNGVPQIAYPSVIGTAPYTGSTLTGRQRGHNDLLNVSSGVVSFIKIKEDGGRIRGISCLGSPYMAGYMGSDGNTCAVRASLYGAQKVRDFFTVPSTLIAPNTINSVKGQWWRRCINGVDIALGSQVSVAYTTSVSGASQYSYADDVVAGPVDASWGDTPGGYYFKVDYAYTNFFGTPFTKTTYMSPGSTYLIAPSSIFPKMHPWPFDVPLMRFAADEATVRYVGNPGWLMPTMTLPALTPVPPTLARAGNTITGTQGSVTRASTQDSAAATSDGTFVKVEAKTTSAFAIGISTATNAAFAGLPVTGEAVDFWSVNGSHLYGCTLQDSVSAKYIQVMP